MRTIDADEAYKVLTDYYHHRTEIQHKALKEAIERVPTVKPIVGEDGMAFSEISKVLIAEATDLRVQRKNEGAEALEEMAAFFSLIGEKVHGKD